MPWYINKKHIYLRVFPRYRDPLVYYIHEKVDPRHWSHKQHKVLAAHPKSHLVNKLMRRIDDIVRDQIILHKIQGVPLTSQALRDILDASLYGVVDKRHTLREYTDHYLCTRSAHVSVSTIKAYRSKMKRMFEIFPTLDFTSITYTWKYSAYETLTAIFSHNNTSKMLSVLRTIVLAAIDEGITEITLPKDLVPSPVEVDSIFLDKDTISMLMNHAYDQDHLANAVRLWSLLYFSGQRISDIRNVINGEIFTISGIKILRFRQQKTTTRVAIPVTDAIDKLISNPPRIISDQRLNDYIKIAAHSAGIADADRITTHTARRSCATNLALDGFPLHMIMDITGHKTERQLMAYIRYSDIQSAVKVSQSDIYQSLHAHLSVS